MFYLDTSVLVAALTNEEATERVLGWLGSRAAGELAISGWVAAELSSALALKVRTGALTLEQRAEVLTAWRRLLDESLIVVPVGAVHFEAASRFIDQHELGLRAGDGLHLAIASERGLTVATLDARVGAAGPKLGVATVML
jgi:uncharacterized protein